MLGRTVHVDAWDEATGVALVVDPARGTRRPVTDYPDFSQLEQADHVVAATPGGGWPACWKDEGPNNGPLTEQVLSSASGISANRWPFRAAIEAVQRSADAHQGVTWLRAALRITGMRHPWTRRRTGSGHAAALVLRSDEVHPT